MGLKAVELFAGVGGFRIALENAGHQVIWSNQWEPGKRVQHASDCYVRHFGPKGHSNEDIAEVPIDEIPDHDLLAGGFPCQDYSVATTLDRSGGIQGKKGVLWWQIYRILKGKKPPYVLLENVDRLLRSPADQRGRDFGVLLRCMTRLGYRVEWRVLNAGDYGFPQRRRRVFIFGAHKDTEEGAWMEDWASTSSYFTTHGFFPPNFPVIQEQMSLVENFHRDVSLPMGVKGTSDRFSFDFKNTGVAVGQRVWARKVQPKKEPIRALKTVLEHDVDEEYYIPEERIERWRYMKGSKREYRVSKKNGHKYFYAEGGIPFPDDLDQPSRTILTGEGGTAPSRIKHIVEDPETGRLRVLTPVECERLNGFPDNWTEGLPERWRYFTMGNALVVGLVERIAKALNGRELQRNSSQKMVPARS